MLFHRHSWIYGKEIRKCERCGQIQTVDGYWDGYGWAHHWVNVSNYIQCNICNGVGRILDIKLNTIQCAKCEGKGVIKQY